MSAPPLIIAAIKLSSILIFLQLLFHSIHANSKWKCSLIICTLSRNNSTEQISFSLIFFFFHLLKLQFVSFLWLLNFSSPRLDYKTRSYFRVKTKLRRTRPFLLFFKLWIRLRITQKLKFTRKRASCELPADEKV